MRRILNDSSAHPRRSAAGGACSSSNDAARSLLPNSAGDVPVRFMKTRSFT
mgnify:CR=1 FL=1